MSRVDVKPVVRAVLEARSAAHAFRAGMLALDRPDKTAAILRAQREFGQLGGAMSVAAIRHAGRTGLIDERGALTFAELDKRSGALAVALRSRGLREGDCVGILARNHRGFLDATFAAAKLGARTLLLNTDFGGPQLRDVCRREGVVLLIHDQEFSGLMEGIETEQGRLLSWSEDSGPDSLDAVIEQHHGQAPDPPGETGSVVLLTSGTTGTPKGAPRQESRSLHPIGALLSKVPYRARGSTYVAPPMFHGVGFTQTVLSCILGCTVITERRFKPGRVLDAITRRRPTALTVVPVMLARMVSLIEQHPGRWDTSSLRIVFCSGSQLEAELVRRAHRAIGEVIYNFYGSTEVGWATFATPEDLSVAPGTAGRPPYGTMVRLYDEAGQPLDGPGQVGRIFVGNGFEFDGYTGGGGKEVIDGLMSTGDVGHFDAAGRLFVDGRDDDMIVSGGENVFPSEVEELLITHEAIEEAAVIGVEDEEFGQRLAAYVVPRPGQELSDDDVKDFVKRNLARYKVPRDVHFLAELPRNPTGKVLKRELRAAHARAA
jgi:fatty-acyl-CoA synthase